MNNPVSAGGTCNTQSRSTHELRNTTLEERVKYIRVSPYSGVAIQVECDPSSDLGLPTMQEFVVQPIQFRPTYAVPLAVGELVPY